MKYQEDLWINKFGNDYIKDNSNSKYIAWKASIFRNIFLSCKISVKSLLEYGANIGLNIPAIKSYYPFIKYYAVEINKLAFNQLKKRNIYSYHQSIFDELNIKCDLVLTFGLLIHIAPDDLNEAYKILYEHSNKYILMIEHFSNNIETKKYRDYDNAFFKGNFANDFIKLYPSAKIIKGGIIKGDLSWKLICI